MLNREPMGMKLGVAGATKATLYCFSAQPRADGDEATTPRSSLTRMRKVSVLNREPMGMKLAKATGLAPSTITFQCSTASRWG